MTFEAEITIVLRFDNESTSTVIDVDDEKTVLDDFDRDDAAQ